VACQCRHIVRPERSLPDLSIHGSPDNCSLQVEACHIQRCLRLLQRPQRLVEIGICNVALSGENR
jgi:hypothetical protein